jgi:hypothetical protein
MTKFEAFKLRVSLLRIWFMKNLVVFFELLFFVGLILVLTGQIDENTPVLGLIFGEMSVSIREALSQNTATGEFWTDLATMIVTILVSTGILSTNLKRVAISDIKSKKLKKALLQAGMYFNQDGKLVKRIEEASKIDLNGDNKIGDTGISVDELPREGFLPGIKRAGEELSTILTMKIETIDDAKKIEDKTKLSETKEAMLLVNSAAKTAAEDLAVQKVAEAIDTVIQEPNIVSKVASGVVRAAKTSVSATGQFFGNVGRAIGNGAVWLTFKFLGIFKKKDKAEKKVAPKKENKKSVIQEVQQPQQKTIQTPASRVLSAEERSQERIKRMMEANKRNVK